MALAAIVLLTSAPASIAVAADSGRWSFIIDAGGRPDAYIMQGDRSLYFVCADKQLFFVYRVAALDEAIAEDERLNLMYDVDPPIDGSGHTVRSMEDLVVGRFDGFVQMTLQGGSVDDWAERAQHANRAIRVAFFLSDGQNMTRYNMTDFPAAGSTAAIKQVRGACR